MSNLNQVILQGNLVADPDVRFTPNGTAVAKFSIAINNGFGENRTTTYVECVSWGKQATVVGEHLKKGKQVIVRGQLVQNRWEDAEGNKRSKIEVKLENFGGFFFTGNGNGNGNAAETETSDETTAQVDSEGKLF